MNELAIARGRVIERIQVTHFDLGEPHLSFLIRRLARVEIIARAYKVNFFGKPYDYDDNGRGRYTPYTLEPPDSCCVAVTLGGSTFLTSQHFEALHPYSQAVIRALSGCDVSKPMFGPFAPTKDVGGLNFDISPDGQFIQRTLEMYHEALYHLAVLLEYPRVLGDRHKMSMYRAPRGLYLERQSLFDALGGKMVDFVPKGRKEGLFPRSAANLQQYIDAVDIDITDRDDYVALNMYPWWPASPSPGSVDQTMRVPDRCINAWVGSESFSEGLTLEHGYGIVSASNTEQVRARVEGELVLPQERGATALRLPQQQSQRGPQQPAVIWHPEEGYDSRNDTSMLYANAFLKQGPWSLNEQVAIPLAPFPPEKIKYIRALVIRHDLVFELTTYSKQMNGSHWQLLRRFSELGPADRATADSEGLFSQFMNWRRERFLLSNIPFNAPPQNIAYFVFCF